jgi:hypothetical protein
MKHIQDNVILLNEALTVMHAQSLMSIEPSIDQLRGKCDITTKRLLITHRSSQHVLNDFVLCLLRFMTHVKHRATACLEPESRYCPKLPSGPRA